MRNSSSLLMYFWSHTSTTCECAVQCKNRGHKTSICKQHAGEKRDGWIRNQQPTFTSAMLITNCQGVSEPSLTAPSKFLLSRDAYNKYLCRQLIKHHIDFNPSVSGWSQIMKITCSLSLGEQNHVAENHFMCDHAMHIICVQESRSITVWYVYPTD